MEVEAVLNVLNEDPTHFYAVFSALRRIGIVAEGREYRAVKNNLRGEIEVFLTNGTVHFDWDEANKMWILKALAL